MPRKKHKARRRKYKKLTFRELANKLELTPIQRVKIAKYMNDRSKEVR